MNQKRMPLDGLLDFMMQRVILMKRVDLLDCPKLRIMDIWILLKNA